MTNDFLRVKLSGGLIARCTAEQWEKIIAYVDRVGARVLYTTVSAGRLQIAREGE